LNFSQNFTLFVYIVAGFTFFNIIIKNDEFCENKWSVGEMCCAAYTVLSITSINSPTSAFQRSAVGGLIDISGYSAATSASALFPPSQIADLVTSLADTTTSTVTIMWTAVGAYLDQGNGR
jgi:hypothetical protein